MDLSVFTQKELEQVIYSDLFGLKRRKDSELATIKKNWLRHLLHLNIEIEKQNPAKFLFFRSLSRPDYKLLFHTAISSISDIPKMVVEDYVLEDNSFNKEVSSFFTKELSNIRYFGFVEEKYRSLVFIRFMRYMFIVSKLDENSFDNLVLFSDMQAVECLASLYFKKKNITTVTMQHGLYIDYKDLDTVNVINYKVQPSDYFLAWGENTKNLIAKYNKNSNIFVCGKPDLDSGQTLSQKRVAKEILIILDQEIFQIQNLELIKIVNVFCLSNSEWKFKVRFHPHNNKLAYYKYYPNLIESNDFANGSIVVGISSSLLYELGSLGYDVLQYKSNVCTIDLHAEKQFENLENLKLRIKNTKNNTPDYSYLIKCIGKESKQHYKNFFESLSNGISPQEVTKTQPFFSIIIPTFNSALFLYKAINSLMNQSFKDFEVIVVDGLSTDQTIPSLIGLTKEDDRFKVFSQKDEGIYDAMNIGLRKAQGKWLYFLGSDDEFYSSKTLFNIYEFISSNNIESGLVYGNVEVKGDVKWAKSGTIYDGKFTDSKIKIKNICHQAIFYNKERKLNCGNYNLKYKLCADWDMNLRVWSKYGGSYIDETIAYFNAGGASTDGSDPEFGKDIKKNIKEYFGE
ncbi:glycosyltransferase family 2 protein [Aliiglaciecola sp. NS0011-25]|uniref:glycosyltransferase family 2 protein n=1 Tax=Aliiglaciecola sp. NS0011-25 TaxID=3127654 RepID=UPI0031057E5A